MLETDDRAFLVPAHIWTPWFSLFGSKSGFNAVEECFGDLSGHIFAMETGLSSDPDMNWLWSHLDRFRLLSNSDAHSGEKLGREANLFSGERSYDGVLRALTGKGVGAKFLGTLEFFPEEGKYHLDGHRACGVVLEPRETLARQGVCPVCGKPLTVGVLSRVLELADRAEPKQPSGQPGFSSLIPLNEILAELLGCGPATKKVMEAYARVVARCGSELTALLDTSPADLDRVQPLLGKAVDRMRQGRVFRQPGYDGQFGVIKVFSEAERRELVRGGLLVAPTKRRKKNQPETELPLEAPSAAPGPQAAPAANPAQLAAAQAGLQPSGPRAPALVLAGPGTGKTFTLMQRVRCALESGAAPESVLAVTFTRRAAAELWERLARVLDADAAGRPKADTLHGLAYEVWKQSWGEVPTILDENAAKKLFAEAAGPQFSGAKLTQAWKTVSLARERGTNAATAVTPPELEDQPELSAALHAYAKTKESWNLVDYTDLLVFWLEQIEASIYQSPFVHVLVDEVQDMTPLQLALTTLLPAPASPPPGKPDADKSGADGPGSDTSGAGFFAIGDPNQSIYGFRGAQPDVLKYLRALWPNLRVVGLSDNYRSAQAVLDLAAPLAAPLAEPLAADGNEAGPARLTARQDIPAQISLFTAPTDASEASWVGEQVRSLLGSTSSTLQDHNDEESLSPGDIAILVRFARLAEPIRRTLDRLGLPVSVPEAEGFWHEPRVARILAAAGRFLGMARTEVEGEDDGLELPDKVLARGPLGLSAYLQDIPPFDRFFWKSDAFAKLTKAFNAHNGWIGLLNHVHLMSASELVKAKAETVQIMSIHAAKGLEFQAVFLPALEDGVLPFFGPDFFAGKTTGMTVDEDEERRLLYVGLTRAKRQLYLSHASRRSLYGRELRLPPSRFVARLDQGLIQRSKLVSRTKRQEQQLTLLNASTGDEG